MDDEALRHVPPTRRESEDEGVKEYLLGIAARETSRKMEEEALAAFPNSRAREGGVAHFYFRDSSDSDNSAEDTPKSQDEAVPHKHRRKSSSVGGQNWWQKHMQHHAQQLAHERGDDDVAMDVDMDQEDTIMRTDSELDRMDLSVPPDPLWTTTSKLAAQDRRDSEAEIEHLRHTFKPHTDTTNASGNTAHGRLWQGHKHAEANRDATGRAGGDRAPDPFGAFGLKPEDPKLHIMRQAASPAMLGKDLTFRQCPSPKQTKLETDHPFFHNEAFRDRNRDTTGQGGLWMGYCCRTESNNDFVVPAAQRHGANMLVTPHPPASPRDADTQQGVCEEPESMLAPPPDSPTRARINGAGLSSSSSTTTKGLHMLHGLDERLRREKAKVELNEKIASEFGDGFVTQVYNYLSLGYPATARAFDDELSKISRVTVDELCSHDEKQMAKGHMLEMDLSTTPEPDRCPRWKALRIYISEWARQHPNLDNLDPLAWGVRERRGSWAI